MRAGAGEGDGALTWQEVRAWLIRLNSREELDFYYEEVFTEAAGRRDWSS